MCPLRTTSLRVLFEEQRAVRSPEGLKAPCWHNRRARLRWVLAKDPNSAQSSSIIGSSGLEKRRLCSRSLRFPSGDLYSTQIPTWGLVESKPWSLRGVRICPCT